MPAPAIGVRRSFAPAAPAAIDWSHPIAQGLTQCVTSRGSLITPPSVSTLIRSRGDFGTGLTNNGSGTELAMRYTVPSANGPWTHFGAVTVTSVALGPIATVYRDALTTTTDRTIGIYTGNLWGLYIFDGAAKYATGASVTVGPHVIVGTSSGSAIQVWADGVPGTAVATSNAGFDGYTPPLSWSLGKSSANGQFGSANATFPGVIHIGGSWNRVLNAAEIEMLTADPFCFLRF